MENYLQRIITKGGVLSPSELQRIIDEAETLELDAVHFGSRQDIIFPKKNRKGNFIEDHKHFDPDVFSTEETNNIVSSYVSIDVFPSTSWLRGTTYLYILEDFGYKPTLKINIVDPKQQVVPIFTGDLNFIASDKEDFWYLYLRLSGYEDTYYPVLIYTWDIVKIAKAIEEHYKKTKSLEALFQLLNEKLDTNNRVIDKELLLGFSPFPYYEGMNKMGINQYWLGLYWRNNRYDLTFLKALCDFCLEYRIGKICLTPWKSLIIKGIHKEHKLALEKLLGQFGINVRHSSLELNWHLPINNKKALDLKKFLVMNFDQNDISTYGLTFGISARRNRQRYFTAIMIEENDAPTVVKDFVVRPTYNVLYAKNFNPSMQHYKVYAQDVDQMDLPGLLMELTKLYFKNLGSNPIGENPKRVLQDKEVVTIEAYQCNDCHTIYDPSIGDPEAGIEAGIMFEDLPDSYCCTMCEGAKENFSKTVLEVV